VYSDKTVVSTCQYYLPFQRYRHFVASGTIDRVQMAFVQAKTINPNPSLRRVGGGGSRLNNMPKVAIVHRFVILGQFDMSAYYSICVVGAKVVKR
jgi:hypothetical protein